MGDFGSRSNFESETISPHFPLSPDRIRSAGRKYGLGPLHNSGNFQSGKTYGTLLSPHNSHLPGPHPQARQRKYVFSKFIYRIKLSEQQLLSF